MKKYKIIFNVLLILFFCSTMELCAASKKHKSKKSIAKQADPSMMIPSDLMRVKTSLKIPFVLGGQNKKFNVGAGSRYAQQWLVAELDFSFGNKFSGTQKLICYPNAKAEFYMLFPLTGNTWYYGVQTINCLLCDPRLKPKTYSVSVFLPPTSVYMYVTRTKADKKALDNMKGVVLIVDKNNKIIGRKVFIEGKERLTEKQQIQLYNTVMNLRKNSKLPVTLWPREKTPWQWIEPERFELPAMQVEPHAAVPAAVQTKTESSASDKKAADDSEEEEE